MSQEKVDKYKKEKANRQQIMKREKRRTRLGVTAAVIVTVGLIGWFGTAVYQNVKTTAAANTSAETVVIDTTDTETYVSNLNAEMSAE